MAESKEKPKSLLMELKEDSEKVVLKLNIQKTKIMASGLLTSWKIEGKKWKQRQILFSWSPKITANGDCSLEGKTCLLLGRKAVTNLDSVLKSRDIALPTKVHIGKAIVFPVVVYGYESCTMKKAEHQRIDVFELWCWETILESPLDSKEIKPVNPKGRKS